MFKIFDDRWAVDVDAAIYAELVGGDLQLSTWASNSSMDESLDAIANRWFNDGEVVITHQFTVPGIVSNMIEAQRLVGEKDGVVFDECNRSMVELMRKQLTEALKMVDSISYKSA